MAHISEVIILYNPNSTGNGRENARDLQKHLRAKEIPTKLIQTKYPGHGEELAKKYANAHPQGMVISSSGDGGYHEVVNGVLGSKNPHVVTGVLPSGNANDHYHFVHHGDLAQRISKGRADHIDVLKIKTPDWTRYAHSYAGLGLTPHIGKQLTEKRPGKIMEKWLVLRNFFTVPGVRIRLHGKPRSFTNLVFSNTGQMSKYLTLSTAASASDGQFEITRTSGSSLYKLTGHLLRAAANRIDEAPQARSYTFSALRNMHIQLDGEVYTILSGQTVRISCEKQLLHTIV